MSSAQHGRGGCANRFLRLLFCREFKDLSDYLEPQDATEMMLVQLYNSYT